ncbi:hypothetical protein HCN44_006869 [Aphidius gifuensis]|uniref:Uncharacterized protein n=1 Tax=Aphidius gifuensis TaxID=684658 RepID=A0A835CTV8_APHGI|nr:uncharacterized protein LOC122849764 isoform X2 [Aphidius gifuensis]XP_044004513.1 uncharacterized protein LOC122849764 isoform X2 [Aphidius gifuensis]KAF7995762.1 hypothetical protein HCN44_006869 [Aphidius gifuensis]
MYAAAGGASIAKRREQKRLQLKQLGGASSAAAAKKTGSGSGLQHQNRFSRSHLAQLHPPAPTGAFHSSHDHHHHQHQHQHQQQQQQQHKNKQRSHSFHHLHQHKRKRPDKIITNSNHLVPPVSPIQFPISPPPLSLESQNSQSLQLKTSNFPFPPPSFLDLRVASPTTSELQCGGGQGPGKAAWQTCSRPSPLPLSPASPQSSRDGYKTKQCEAHRRWMKRNRIRDASYCYGSSDEDEEASSNFTNRRRGEVNAAVNTVLYAGLGTTALGLVISFVGTGEKGFLSPELRLVGPTLVCAGLLCCLLRVLLCLCLCRCCVDCRWTPCRVVIVDKDKVKNIDEHNSSSKTTTTLLPKSTQQIMTSTAIKTIKETTSCNKIPINLAIPSSSSSSSTTNKNKSTKGHELLLSPSQLPE